MDFGIYQQQAMRTAKPMSTEIENLMHAAIGACGEVGELADALKKTWLYGKPLDRDNVAEELGDILWYVAIGCHALGVSMSDVAQRNIDKLKVRYPEKYSDQLASVRLDKQ